MSQGKGHKQAERGREVKKLQGQRAGKAGLAVIGDSGGIGSPQPRSPTHRVVSGRGKTINSASPSMSVPALPCPPISPNGFVFDSPVSIDTTHELPDRATQCPDGQSSGDYFIKELQNPQIAHLNKASVVNLPEFPTCPGSNLVPHEHTVKRPNPSAEFCNKYPREASLYNTVVACGKPNYMGAKEKVHHQLNIPAWRSLEKYISDKQLVDFLDYGFPIGYIGEHPPTCKLINHSSARQAPQHVDKYLATEVEKQAALGPLSQPPFVEWWRNNPLMTREKRESQDRRVILDLSFPSPTSVNCQIPKMLNIWSYICGPSILRYKKYIYILSISKKYTCIPVDYMCVGLYSRKLSLDISSASLLLYYQ